MKMKKEIIIDAENSAVGRIASFAAKKALQDNAVIIINSEKAVITGKKKSILKKYIEKIQIGGSSQKGPYTPRKPVGILRRAVRGMLPHKITRGREAFKKVRCYEDIPKEYENAEKIKIPQRILKDFITLKDLSKYLGK